MGEIEFNKKKLKTTRAECRVEIAQATNKISDVSRLEIAIVFEGQVVIISKGNALQLSKKLNDALKKIVRICIIRE